MRECAGRDREHEAPKEISFLGLRDGINKAALRSPLEWPEPTSLVALTILSHWLWLPLAFISSLRFQIFHD